MKDSSQLSTVNSQLPKGWEVKKLGDVCEIYQPKTISKKDMIIDGEFPVFGANGIIGQYDKYNHEDAQLLVTCRGATCGSVNISLPKSWINGNAMVIKPKNCSLKRDFLEYFFRGSIGISNVITGAAQPQITRQNLSPVEIPIPPLPEQHRIVEILDKAFIAIDKAKQNAEQNLRNAKEVFQSKLQSIFDNGKLKVENGEWEKHTLKQVCEITSKLVDPKERQYQDMIHIGAGNIVAENGALIDLKTAREEELISGKFVFDKSMVLYSKIRPYLMKIVKCDFKGLCSADIYPLTPLKDKITKSFLYYLLYSSEFTRYAIEGSQRSGMPKVNRSHLFNYSFYCPSLTEQEQLSQSLDKISAEIDNLAAIYQQKLANLDELKKSILLKAFTGELV